MNPILHFLFILFKKFFLSRKLKARGKRVTHCFFFHEWSTSFLSFVPLVLFPMSVYLFFFIGHEGAVVRLGKPPINLPRHLLFAVFSPLRSLFFLSLFNPLGSSQYSPLFFYPAVCIYIYTFPRFYLWQTIEKRRLQFECDEGRNWGGKKQQERRCHWNRPSSSNNFL